MNSCFQNFILHDSIINNICIKDSLLLIEFIEGPYIKNDSSDEVKKLYNCRMNIIIDQLEIGKEYEHINIQVIHRKKVKIISFYEFTKLVKKSKFKVYLNYYSNFANSILIKGTIFPLEIELTISEIQSIVIKHL